MIRVFFVRRRHWWLLGVAVLLLSGAGATWLLWPRSEPRPMTYSEILAERDRPTLRDWLRRMVHGLGL